MITHITKHALWCTVDALPESGHIRCYRCPLVGYVLEWLKIAVKVTVVTAGRQTEVYLDKASIERWLQKNTPQPQSPWPEQVVALAQLVGRAPPTPPAPPPPPKILQKEMEYANRKIVEWEEFEDRRRQDRENPYAYLREVVKYYQDNPPEPQSHFQKKLDEYDRRIAEAQKYEDETGQPHPVCDFYELQRRKLSAMSRRYKLRHLSDQEYEDLPKPEPCI